MSQLLPNPETVTVPLNGETKKPLLNDQERQAFIRSLHEAEKSIDRGDFSIFEHDSFLDKLRADYASHRTAE